MKRPSIRLPQGARAGFALVITLALMVLLTLLVVGLLSLSSVSLRSAGEAAPLGQARANARLALALAFDQLQRQTGLDTRITAPADMLASDKASVVANAGWRGVWRSNATTPKVYKPGRSDFFVEWLVTNADKQPLPQGSALEPVAGESTVIRKADGLPDVSVPLLETPDHGWLGWWTDDESLKARADIAQTESASTGEMSVARHAAPRLGPEVATGVVGFTATAKNAPGLVTPGNLALAAKKWPDRQGRQFTTYSQSLLTDVRNGGLKQDLNALFELPKKTFDDKENFVPIFGQWTGNGSASNAKVYLYGSPAIAMGARWNHLYAYYNLYKDITFSGGEPRVQPKAPLIDWHDADNYVSFGDEAGGFRYPRMAKIIYVFSYTATKDSDAANQKPYALQIATDIFVTLWNPFDARIHFPVNTKFFAKLSSGLPMKFDCRVNGTAVGSQLGLDDLFGTYHWFEEMFNNPVGDRQFSMGPGETVVFSLKKGGNGAVEFWPGAFFDDSLTKDFPQVTGNGSEKISIGLLPDQPNDAGGGDSVPNSQYIDFWIKDSNLGWPYYEHRGEILSRSDAPFLKQMKAVPATDVPSVSLKDVVGRKQPFGAFIMETKTALDSVTPIPAYLNTGTTRLSSKLTNDIGQFANERLEYKVEPVTGFDSDIIQVTLSNSQNGPNHGYVGSGRGPATGQTHFLFASIPTVPLTSLAQFRHAGVGDGASTLRATYWDFNSTPNPPYADQSIGNSYAHPLVPPDVSSKGNMLDHRYLGNEVLWDKYFLSSLAPRNAVTFGKAKSMAETWSTFLDGSAKLINSRFSPWLGGETPKDISKRSFTSATSGAIAIDAYRKIAANLLLDGGFNINSTSEDAWHAFLASTRKASLNRLAKSGGTQGQKVAGSGTVFSRTETVLDGAADAGSNGYSSHYCGYRDITDEKLGTLAKEIVTQVRKRGPFLNLSEFINRRLTTDPDLAICGALQAAIDASGINDIAAAGGKAGMSSPDGATMAFPKASALNTAAGCPGWLMQADLLDPLGPMIVARGDTFRIRGYGESRDAQGKVLASAWCEAVVQRVPSYMDVTEAADVAPAKKPLNLRFGRRYQWISFRWLDGPQD